MIAIHTNQATYNELLYAMVKKSEERQVELDNFQPGNYRIHYSEQTQRIAA